MAKGDYYDESGNFDNARDFGVDPEAYGRPLSDYSDENQQYLKDHAQSTVDGNPIDEKERGIFNRVGRDKDGSRQLLKDGEKDASEKPNTRGKGGDKKASLGEKENNVPADDDSAASKIKNSVQGIKDLKSGNVIKAAGRLKKAGPLGAILALILGFACFSFLGQLAMPFSLVAQFQEQFDSISVSQTMRTRAFLRYQMDTDNTKNCIRAHYFKADEFKPSSRMRNKLAARGITFEEVDGVTVMRYNGKTIVADPSQATDGRIYFEQAYNEDESFRNSYIEGARTWRGSVAAWFDSKMSSFLKKIGIDRNLWNDYKKSKNGTDNDSDMDNFRNEVANRADSDSADGKISTTDAEQPTSTNDAGEEVPDGDPVTTRGEPQDVNLSRNDIAVDSNGNTDSSGLKSKLGSIGEAAFGKIKSWAMMGVGMVCGTADAVGAVSAIVAAYQALQIIQTTTMIFEGIQKVQAGNGDGAPLHEIAQSLTQPAEATYTEVLDTDNEGNVTDSKVTKNNRSAMEANAIGALYGGTTVDQNDPSVASFNINKTTNRLFNKLGSESFLGNLNSSIGNIAGAASAGFQALAVSAASFRACTYARLAASAVGAVEDTVTLVTEVAGCVGAAVVTFGAALVGCIAGAALSEEAFTLAVQTVKSLAIGVIVSFLTPFVAQVLTRKIATNVMGEDLGNAIVSGANMYMGQNHQNSGGSIASKESLIGYYQAQDQVIADNARYERETHGPFDITSKYTFLGSLANQMIPLASSTTSLSKTINGLSTLVGNASSSLLPKSSAVSSAIKAQAESDNTERNCPNIADIGGVADAFCNPYFITDTSTLNTHPADIIDDSDLDNDLEKDENDNPVVKENSNLAKYIIYCGERSSQFGTADQNIMAQVTAATDLDSAAGTNINAGDVSVSPLNSVVGSLPIIGDSLDIVDNTAKIENMGWITGASCVTGYEKTSAEIKTTSWSEEKKYQRFIEDQRLAEAQGLIEESAVTKFVAQYYEEHPLDNTFEGILARYSGLTKENVVATLDLMKLMDFVADYNPVNLYPYPAIENAQESISIDMGESPDYLVVVILSSDIEIEKKKETLII